MLLAETDEQISSTSGHNRHGNVEALQLDETVGAARTILIAERQEEMASEGRIDEPFKRGHSQTSVFWSLPTPHHPVIKGSDWLVAMVMSICCLTCLSVLPMLVGQWKKIILFTSAGAFFLSGRFVYHKWAINIQTYYLVFIYTVMVQVLCPSAQHPREERREPPNLWMWVRRKAQKEKRELVKPGPTGRKEIPYPASWMLIEIWFLDILRLLSTYFRTCNHDW